MSVMARTVEQLHEEASSLSEEDRITLATLLLDGITLEPDASIDDAWRQELDKRDAADQSAPSRGVPVEALRSRLHDKLKSS